MQIVLEDHTSDIPEIPTLNLDAPTTTILALSVVKLLAKIISFFTHPDTFYNEGCRTLVLSAFRVYSFLTSASNDPMVDKLSLHLGDILVEALAVCVIVRRTWVHTARHLARLPWESKISDPIQAMLDSWTLLAFHCLRPWHSSLVDAVNLLAMGKEPVGRRSIEFGAGSPRTLSNMLEGRYFLVHQVWSTPWFAPCAPPGCFAIRVNCSYQDLQSTMCRLDALDRAGKGPDASTSIVDAMLHIVLSSVIFIYAADGRVDHLLDGDTTSLMCRATTSIRSRLTPRTLPPPPTPIASTGSPQIEKTVSKPVMQGASGLPSRNREPQLRPDAPGSGVDAIGRSQFGGAQSSRSGPGQTAARQVQRVLTARPLEDRRGGPARGVGSICDEEEMPMSEGAQSGVELTESLEVTGKACQARRSNPCGPGQTARKATSPRRNEPSKPSLRPTRHKAH